MQNIVPGHTYKLDVIGEEYIPYPPVEFNFLHCEQSTENDTRPKRGKFSVVSPGTTNEEVLRVLIDRMEFLNEKLPCSQNNATIGHLKDALNFLKLRTKDREQRGVESSEAA